VKLKFSLLTTLLILSNHSLAATINTSSSGEITGISGVLVDTKYYDVTFSDVWDGVMYDASFAWSATSSLVNLISDGGEFQGSVFDTNPTATRGCESLLFTKSCYLWTVIEEGNLTEFDVAPWEVSHVGLYFIGGPAARNSNETDFTDTDVYKRRVFDYSDNLSTIGNNFSSSNTTFSSWSESSYQVPSNVPLPTAAFLFTPAFLGFTLLRRKKNP
jgi:hypothetical protein